MWAFPHWGISLQPSISWDRSGLASSWDTVVTNQSELLEYSSAWLSIAVRFRGHSHCHSIIMSILPRVTRTSGSLWRPEHATQHTYTMQLSGTCWKARDEEGGPLHNSHLSTSKAVTGPGRARVPGCVDWWLELEHQNLMRRKWSW